VSNIKLLSTRA